MTGVYGAMGRNCYCHHHREEVPLEVHHIWPLGDGGPNVAGNRISLCANAHGSVHSLLDMIRKVGDLTAVPWPVRRKYGRRVRELAERGWRQIRAAQEATGA